MLASVNCHHFALWSARRRGLFTRPDTRTDRPRRYTANEHADGHADTYSYSHTSPSHADIFSHPHSHTFPCHLYTTHLPYTRSFPPYTPYSHTNTSHPYAPNFLHPCPPTRPGVRHAGRLLGWDRRVGAGGVRRGPARGRIGHRLPGRG